MPGQVRAILMSAFHGYGTAAAKWDHQQQRLQCDAALLLEQRGSWPQRPQRTCCGSSALGARACGGT